MEFASQIPVVEGGPAERGEPHELVPGVGELEAIPEPTEREGGSRNREKNLFFSRFRKTEGRPVSGRRDR